MQTPTDKRKNDSAPESSIRRRLIGFFMFPIAFFPFIALFTYNWHDISTLCIPPNEPTSNLIGAVGNWFAYDGYQLFGLGIWSVPPICLYAGVRLAFGRSFNPGRRTLGVLLFVLASTCLLQLTGHIPAIANILHVLNIEPNAGGAVGYLVMTRGLARLLSPFGSGVLMICLMVFSVFLTIGFHNFVSALARLTAWAADRSNKEDEEEEEAEKPEEKAAEDDSADEEADDEKATAAEAEKAAKKEAERKAEEDDKAAAREELLRKREEEQRQKEARKQQRLEEKRRKNESRQAELPWQQDFVPAFENTISANTAAHSPSPTYPSVAPAAAPVPPPAPAPAPAAPAPVVTPARSIARPESTDPMPPFTPPVSVQVKSVAEPAPAAAPQTAAPPRSYELPPVSLLNDPPAKTSSGENTEAMVQRLIETLKLFDVNAQRAYVVPGPVVTQYALTLDPGTRVEKVAGLQRNIQMALQATSLRIEAPIPGKNAVGIEVPNSKPASVCFREIFDGELWQNNSPGKFQVPLLLGKDAAGNDLVADLAKLPHLLVAGATGQGKSVCLNSIINGLLMCRTPKQLKLIMVDPKRVEFTSYNQLPHLLVPIINDTKKVVFALRSAVAEMDHRLKLFAKVGCRNIVDFNTRKKVTQTVMAGFGNDEVVGADSDVPETVPYIVIIIDEVADIMQAAKKEVEPVIARLTALARATGIHLILATQRPSADVITGVIKGNIPGRIAFKTSSSIDSRTILDATGSELLIGKGDMLFKMADGRLLRAQGSYISDGEINNIVSFFGERYKAEFDPKLTKRLEKIKEADPNEGIDEDENEETEVPAEPLAAPTANGMPAPSGMTQSKEDTLYRKALEVLRDTKRASVSHLQRRMGIGYNHAARLVDLLEERGVIGTAKGAGPREILLDPEAIIAQMDGGAAPAPGMAEAAPAPDAMEMAAADPSAIPPDGSALGFPQQN